MRALVFALVFVSASCATPEPPAPPPKPEPPPCDDCAYISKEQLRQFMYETYKQGVARGNEACTL